MFACVCLCVSGFIWAEIKEMWDGGFTEYIHDWWNLMDFAMNSLYLATISLKIVAYVKVKASAPDIKIDLKIMRPLMFKQCNKTERLWQYCVIRQ